MGPCRWAQHDALILEQAAKFASAKPSVLHSDMLSEHGADNTRQTHWDLVTGRARPPGVASRKRRTSWPGRKASGPSRAMKSLARHLTRTCGHHGFYALHRSLVHGLNREPGHAGACLSRMRIKAATTLAEQKRHSGFRQVQYGNGGHASLQRAAGSATPFTSAASPPHGSQQLLHLRYMHKCSTLTSASRKPLAQRVAVAQVCTCRPPAQAPPPRARPRRRSTARRSHRARRPLGPLGQTAPRPPALKLPAGSGPARVSSRRPRHPRPQQGRLQA